jgi:uracil-DNA glycosylase
MPSLSPQGRFPENLPPVWRRELSAEAQKSYFQSLVAFLKSEYGSGRRIFPARDKVLRALQCVDYDEVSVVILGQDPYHGENQAVGLSFAVPNTLARKPPSLMNIYKEIETDLGCKVDRNHSELSHWAAQGVLLLNTVLTVRESEAYSHKEKGWETFTDKVISLLNEREAPVVFILWGAHARKKKALITHSRHPIIESAHPSPLSAHNGFFGSRPFSRANQLLTQLGRSPIDWARTE